MIRYGFCPSEGTFFQSLYAIMILYLTDKWLIVHRGDALTPRIGEFVHARCAIIFLPFIVELVRQTLSYIAIENRGFSYQEINREKMKGADGSDISDRRDIYWDISDASKWTDFSSICVRLDSFGKMTRNCHRTICPDGRRIPMKSVQMDRNHHVFRSKWT